MENPKQNKKKYYYSRTLDRGLNILEAFIDANSEMGLIEISKATDLDKSTVHRLVLHLAEKGYLEQNPATSKYSLGKKFISFGNLVLNQMEVRRIVRPFLEKLSAETNKTAHLVVLNRHEGIYIDKFEDPAAHVSYSRIGKSAPLHCTAVGKILLSSFNESELKCLLENIPLVKFTENTITDKKELFEHIKTIKTSGYAVDNFELEDSLKCISAPIYSYKGAIKAAISVSGMGGNMGHPHEERLIKTVCRIADAASKQFGFEL